jgi:hypothetical protein
MGAWMEVSCFDSGGGKYYVALWLVTKYGDYNIVQTTKKMSRMSRHYL